MISSEVIYGKYDYFDNRINQKKKRFILFDKDEPFLLNLINRYLPVEKKEVGLFSIKVIETLIPLLEGYEDEQKQGSWSLMRR